MIEALYRVAGHSLDVAGLVPRVPVVGSCSVLVHAASAGETKAAIALRSAASGHRWRVISGTQAGVAMGADQRSPRDTPGAVSRLFDDARPQLLLLIEAEIWPTLLAEARRRDVPVAVVGARMTPRALAGWRCVPGPLRSNILKRVGFWGAASRADAVRIAQIGVDPTLIEVTGLLKFPELVEPTTVLSRQRDAEEIDWGRDGPLVVLGSVHPGEVRAFESAVRDTPLDSRWSRWLVAPRHQPNRQLRSYARVIGAHLEERFGVLRSWYAAADATFVGGGLSGRGVHDLLEPVLAGRRPLYFGDRDDSGGLGAELQERGLALRLDAGPVDVSAALIPCDEHVVGDLDGRQSTLDALSRRGLL
jgi:3-deoxy-D-manno-octulosonic-acid transferase